MLDPSGPHGCCTFALSHCLCKVEYWPEAGISKKNEKISRIFEKLSQNMNFVISLHFHSLERQARERKCAAPVRSKKPGSAVRGREEAQEVACDFVGLVE